MKYYATALVFFINNYFKIKLYTRVTQFKFSTHFHRRLQVSTHLLDQTKDDRKF